jgi:hypothetical protein
MNASKKSLPVFYGLCLYAIFNLVSMASMSISVGVFIALLLISAGGVRPLLKKIPKTYLRVSLVLAVACAVSLVVGQKIMTCSYSKIFL